MDPLESAEKELSDVSERARRLVDSTEPRLFTVRPDLSSWSASECIAHLNISTEMILPVLQASLDDARSRGLTGGHASMDWLGRILRWFLEPPVRTRVKTSARFVPRAVRAKAESIAEFTSLQSKLLEQLRSARGLALSRIKIVSPFDKRVSYNVYSAFMIMAAHQRRHLWQAEQAVEALRRRVEVKNQKG